MYEYYNTHTHTHARGLASSVIMLIFIYFQRKGIIGLKIKSDKFYKKPNECTNDTHKSAFSLMHETALQCVSYVQLFGFLQMNIYAKCTE
jgi:hypothetical protein